MDAIAIYQAGIKSVVATMGAAFTEEQITTLWRLSSEPWFVLMRTERALLQPIGPLIGFFRY